MCKNISNTVLICAKIYNIKLNFDKFLESIIEFLNSHCEIVSGQSCPGEFTCTIICQRGTGETRLPVRML